MSLEQEIMKVKEDYPIEIIYDYTADEIKDALLIYQKQKLYLKNYIYTAILAVSFISFLYSAFSDLANSHLSLFLAALTVVVAVMIWYNPIKYRKAMVQAVKNSEEGFHNYKINFYEDYFTTHAADIQQDDESYVEKIEYINSKLIIFEIPDLLIITFGKEKLFVVPKRCLGEVAEEIIFLLKTKLVENYKKID